jgi:deoxyribodipyrimidine photo-lyase
MWFRQDLRVQDNTALIQAVADAKDIVPIFIMDTQILTRSPTGDRRIGFLLDVVKQLDASLQAL